MNNDKYAKYSAGKVRYSQGGAYSVNSKSTSQKKGCGMYALLPLLVILGGAVKLAVILLS